LAPECVVEAMPPATIGAGDLPVQKARVPLMLALTRTSDPREIARIFAAHQ